MCGLVLKLYMMSNETELILSIHRLEQLLHEKMFHIQNKERE